MPNTREKLIELLRAIAHENCFGSIYNIADYLIANGVTFMDDRPRFFIKSNQKCIEELEQIIGSGPVVLQIGDESIIPIHPGRWIPVTERLPDTAERVLVCKTWLGMVYKPEYGYYQDFPNQNGCWYVLTEFGYFPQTNVITHWMPLPEPPKGE